MFYFRSRSRVKGSLVVKVFMNINARQLNKMVYIGCKPYVVLNSRMKKKEKTLTQRKKMKKRKKRKRTMKKQRKLKGEEKKESEKMMTMMMMMMTDVNYLSKYGEAHSIEKDDSRIYSLVGIQPMIEVATNNNIYNDNNDNGNIIIIERN